MDRLDPARASKSDELNQPRSPGRRPPRRTPRSLTRSDARQRAHQATPTRTRETTADRGTRPSRTDRRRRPPPSGRPSAAIRNTGGRTRHAAAAPVARDANARPSATRIPTGAESERDRGGRPRDAIGAQNGQRAAAISTQAGALIPDQSAYETDAARHATTQLEGNPETETDPDHGLLWATGRRADRHERSIWDALKSADDSDANSRRTRPRPARSDRIAEDPQEAAGRRDGRRPGHSGRGDPSRQPVRREHRRARHSSARTAEGARASHTSEPKPSSSGRPAWSVTPSTEVGCAVGSSGRLPRSRSRKPTPETAPRGPTGPTPGSTITRPTRRGVGQWRIELRRSGPWKHIFTASGSLVHADMTGARRLAEL